MFFGQCVILPQGSFPACISVISPLPHLSTLHHLAKFPILDAVWLPFTYPCDVTVPLSLAVIMCERAKSAEATTRPRACR